MTHAHEPNHALPAADADRRYLIVALLLITGFMAGELAAAITSRSLALLADTGHMLIDAASIGISLWALHLASQPASKIWSYGLKRAEILAAAANGVGLLVIGALVAVEAIRRLLNPSSVAGGTVLIVALVGIVVNVVATYVLNQANRSSLNIEGAFQHILTDLYGFVGTAAAGIVVLTTGWSRADPIASLLVVALILRASWSLLRESGRVLLEGTPQSVDLDDVRAHLSELPEVLAVHDLHAWTLTSSLPALSAHVVVTDDCFNSGNAGRVLDHLQDCLVNHFDVEHSTFQLEAASHADHEPKMHD
jgi:cobalt-zinc-cadmium efflux system protein